MRTATINNILLPPRFIESFFSTRLGRRLLNCTAHKYPRTIIIISDTNEGVYERALIRWQRVTPLECFGLPTFLGEKCKIDKRGHLQRFIQGSGIHTQEDFKFE
jgi:hypothetical protein